MSSGNHKQVESFQTSRSPAERFNDFLQSRKMRSTEQRRLLLKYVFEQDEEDHFDADQLMERLPKRGQQGYVSRPTVYRTLTEFVEAGLLVKFELDGRSVYEFNYGYPDHEHLYCTECSKLIEFQSDVIDQVKEEVAKFYKFQPSSHRFIIQGICEECRQKRRRRRRVDRI